VRTTEEKRKREKQDDAVEIGLCLTWSWAADASMLILDWVAMGALSVYGDVVTSTETGRTNSQPVPRKLETSWSWWGRTRVRLRCPSRQSWARKIAAPVQ
jgi:hypothetical protein